MLQDKAMLELHCPECSASSSCMDAAELTAEIQLMIRTAVDRVHPISSQVIKTVNQFDDEAKYKVKCSKIPVVIFPICSILVATLENICKYVQCRPPNLQAAKHLLKCYCRVCNEKQWRQSNEDQMAKGRCSLPK